MVANAQAAALTCLICLSRLSPAPQALMHPLRPQQLRPETGVVAGVYSGNLRLHVNHIAHTLIPVARVGLMFQKTHSLLGTLRRCESSRSVLLKCNESQMIPSKPATRSSVISCAVGMCSVTCSACNIRSCSRWHVNTCCGRSINSFSSR